MGHATRDRVPKNACKNVGVQIFLSVCSLQKEIGDVSVVRFFVYTYVVYWSYIGHIRIYRICIHVYSPKLYTVIYVYAP